MRIERYSVKDCECRSEAMHTDSYYSWAPAPTPTPAHSMFSNSKEKALRRDWEENADRGADARKKTTTYVTLLQELRPTVTTHACVQKRGGKRVSREAKEK